MTRAVEGELFCLTSFDQLFQSRLFNAKLIKRIYIK